MPIINGTTGRDVLTGTAEADVISGGEGGDTIDGGAGADTIYGFGASDVNGGAAATIDATLLASGLARPVFAASPPGDPDRLFIIEQHTGIIRILDLTTNTVLPTPFLDIPNNEIRMAGEEGLLGLAFHPDYATNGIYFVYVTNAAGNNEVWRYTRGADPDVSSTTRELVITINHPGETNHNGGWMGFGPDGYLYIATGDGGGGGDPNNNAQNINSLLGKLLRIDVDSDDPSRPGSYAIPVDNPYAGVGVNGADEVFAIGLRNPWRVSFDTATGDVLIGDVGQGAREEINFVPAGTLGGRNFGWVVREGSQVYDDTRGGNPPANSPLFTHPIFEYTHGNGPEQGYSITGGYVVRGPDAGGQGLYLFADFVTGNFWTLRASASGAEDVIRRNDQVVVSGGDFDQIASFAVDGQGRVYVIGLDGEIHRLTFNSGAGDTGDILNGGEGDDQIYGGLAADRLNGGTGDDLLNGGLGADIMSGGLGDDTYYIDNNLDFVSENVGEGTDTVISTLTRQLVANFENLTLSGSSAINGLGNALNNVIIGNSAVNWLYGYDGADVLNGGGDADKMFGGAGDDTYYIDNNLDFVVENVGEGTDTVISTLTRQLVANFENLVLSGSGAINGLGNALNNTVTGNSAVNWLYGYDGADILDGGGDADKMFGGAGDDTYYIDNNLDFIVENVGEGTDAVVSTLTRQLVANFENLVLSGSSAINGLGNSANNVITGNSAVNWLYGYDGNDTLNGGGDADKMFGGAGDDTYYVDNNLDFIVENASEGTDTVVSTLTRQLGANFENLVLTGNAAINGIGNSLDNRITGNVAVNTLIGDAGADTFVFATAIGGGNIDTITDFNVSDDTIELSVSIFSGIGLGALSSNAFVIGAAAADADDRIIYNSATGALYYDVDGNGAGAAIQIATLTAGLSLTNNDFIGGP